MTFWRRPVTRQRQNRPRIAPLLAALVLGALAARPASAQEGIAIPAPAADAPAVSGPVAVAVVAGGCFWGVQGVFQHTAGVLNAVSGYAGGEADTGHYNLVVRGTTGHAEAVEITYDPEKISYATVLQIFFSVAHDPTQLDRQGPDVGTQYRTAIFPQDEAQAQFARAYIAQLNQARVFDAAIVTKIEADRPFYRAEDYHQDYMTRNPTQPYIAYYDLPKVENLKRLFPDIYREAPVLVSQADPAD